MTGFRKIALAGFIVSGLIVEGLQYLIIQDLKSENSDLSAKVKRCSSQQEQSVWKFMAAYDYGYANGKHGARTDCMIYNPCEVIDFDKVIGREGK